MTTFWPRTDAPAAPQILSEVPKDWRRDRAFAPSYQSLEYSRDGAALLACHEEDAVVVLSTSSERIPIVASITLPSGTAPVCGRWVNAAADVFVITSKVPASTSPLVYGVHVLQLRESGPAALRCLAAHASAVEDVAANPTYSLLATTSHAAALGGDCAVVLWDIRAPSAAAGVAAAAAPRVRLSKQGGGKLLGGVRVAWEPSGGVLGVATSDTAELGAVLRLFDVRVNGPPFAHIPMPLEAGAALFSLAFPPSGRVAAAATRDGCVALVATDPPPPPPQQGPPAFAHESEWDDIRVPPVPCAPCFDPSGAHLVGCSEVGEVRSLRAQLWAGGEWAPAPALDTARWAAAGVEHVEPPRALACHPRLEQLALAGHGLCVYQK